MFTAGRGENGSGSRVQLTSMPDACGQRRWILYRYPNVVKAEETTPRVTLFLLAMPSAASGRMVSQAVSA